MTDVSPRKLTELYREMGARPAAMGARIASGVIDLVLLVTVAAIDFLAFGMMMVGHSQVASINGDGEPVLPSSERYDPVSIALALAPVVLFWLWNRVVRVSRGGASVGMGWAGIRLVAVRTGTSPSADMALGRELLGLVLLPLGLGVWSALLDRDRRGLHDRVAGVAMIEPPE